MEKKHKYQNIWCILPETLCPQWQKAERFTWPQSTFQLAERKRGLPITQICRNPVWRGWFCSGFYTTVRANKEAITLHSSLEFSLTLPHHQLGQESTGHQEALLRKPVPPQWTSGKTEWPSAHTLQAQLCVGAQVRRCETLWRCFTSKWDLKGHTSEVYFLLYRKTIFLILEFSFTEEIFYWAQVPFWIANWHSFKVQRKKNSTPHSFLDSTWPQTIQELRVHLLSCGHQ